jgi:hypothetical protein
MSEIINPLQLPLDDLFEQLNLLNGLQFHLNNQLDLFKKMIRERWNDSGLDLSYLGAGAVLVFRDLSECPANGWARYYPSGQFVSKGEEFFKVSDELVGRSALWAVTQAYEAFETFVKDLAACYLYNNQDQVQLKKIRKHMNILKKNNYDPKNLDYWQSFVRLAYRKTEDLLGYFRILSSEVEEFEKKNNRAFDLTEWYAVVAEARHAATHSNGIIKRLRTEGWISERLKLLERFISGVEVDSGYRMNPTFEETNQNLVIFSEYGFALFKALSKAKGYDWNILKKDQTRKNA